MIDRFVESMVITREVLSGAGLLAQVTALVELNGLEEVEIAVNGEKVLNFVCFENVVHEPRDFELFGTDLSNFCGRIFDVGFGKVFVVADQDIPCFQTLKPS